MSTVSIEIWQKSDYSLPDPWLPMSTSFFIKMFNIFPELAVNHLDADYNSFWIGASDAAHYTNWTWIDGSPMRFSNWGPGQPLEDRHCGTMLISTGKWFSQVCDERIQFLCQYPNGAYSPTCPPCLEIWWFKFFLLQQSTSHVNKLPHIV